MMRTPLISVVVPSFNQARYLGATLDSLLAQDDPALEIVVVDGGSSDGSADLLRRRSGELAWWTTEPDRGQSDAINKGFAHCSGDWLCWLNSDDMLRPGALRTLREQIAREPATRWWIGAGLFVDEHGHTIRPFGAPHGLREAAQLADWATHWFAQPSTFFTRELFDAAGGRVREDLHYAMDLELWLRLAALAPPGIVDAQLSAYRLHAAAKTTVIPPECEAEIVRVVAEHLGLEAALARVRRIAAERRDAQQRVARLEAAFAPALAVHRTFQRLRAARGGGPA